VPQTARIGARIPAAAAATDPGPPGRLIVCGPGSATPPAAIPGTVTDVIAAAPPAVTVGAETGGRGV
jgi:hypothetical protein